MKANFSINPYARRIAYQLSQLACCTLIYFTISTLHADNLICSITNANVGGGEDLISPDTIPVSGDTINAVAFYNVSDTVAIFTDGMDSIIYLREDTTVYIAQTDSVITYYLGDIDTSVLFNKPIDSIDYYYATDTAGYLIPAYEDIAYRLYPKDSALVVGKTTEINIAIEGLSDVTYVTLSDNVMPINKGLFGVHIPGAFTDDHLSEQDANYMAGWNALRDLKPASLRFPSGAEGRWMHLMPYDIDWDCDKDPVKGYGYDIYEIIRFMDVTDDDGDAIPDLEADNAAFLASIFTDMNNPADDPPYACNNCNTWMNASKYRNLFEGLYEVWIKQESHSLNPVDPSFAKPAIDQFIEMVNYIESYWHTADPSYKIEVILDLSIPSISETECKDIINYLRNGAPAIEGGNGVTNVNVVGVEMGNEVYFEWAPLMMGFNEFADYWSYINGGSADIAWKDLYYDYLFGPTTADHLPAEVPTCEDAWDERTYSNHNYLRAMKLETTPAPKVGIPAAVDVEDGPFRVEAPDTPENPCVDCRLSDGWTNISDYYDDTFLDHTGTLKFDAIVLHNYYAANADNWMGIPLHYLCTSYPSTGLPDCTPTACGLFEFNKWQMDSYDTRLQPAFDAMMGYPVVDVYDGTIKEQTGNIKEFLKTRYIDSYLTVNSTLHFDNTTAYPKELWQTEKNLKNEINGVEYFQPPYPSIDLTLENKKLFSIYDNTFVHGYLTMEWFLKDLKLNFFTSYFNQGFFTYSHFHSLGSGGWASLLSIADCADEYYLSGESIETGGDKYFMKRTTYWTYYLLSTIVKEDLQYLKSNTSIPTATSVNQPVTMFINSNKTYVYGFFSNASAESRNIIVYANNLPNLFPGTLKVKLLNPHLYMVDAKYPYSNSGRSILYTNLSSDQLRLNMCYGCESAALSGPYHPVEITGITSRWNVPELIPASNNAICVTVPPYSFGYFKSAINVIYPKGDISNVSLTEDQFTLYPNPAAEYFTLQTENTELSENAFTISIYDAAGHLIFTTEATIGGRIDVHFLPAGIYIVTITTEQNQKISKSLVKL